MANTVARNEQLRRAAVIRALIVSILNENQDPLESSQIVKKLGSALEDNGYTPLSISNFLYTMKNTNLISCMKVDGKMKYAASGILGNSVSVSPKVSSEKSNKLTKNTPVGVTIDIVKSTGRIRVSFKGLIIEVGVID